MLPFEHGQRHQPSVARLGVKRVTAVKLLHHKSNRTIAGRSARVDICRVSFIVHLFLRLLRPRLDRTTSLARPVSVCKTKKKARRSVPEMDVGAYQCLAPASRRARHAAALLCSVAIATGCNHGSAFRASCAALSAASTASAAAL